MLLCKELCYAMQNHNRHFDDLRHRLIGNKASMLMFKLWLGTKWWIKETKDKCNHEANGNGIGKGVVYMLNHV
jgi:hypothetical protein